jgi:3-phytase
MTPAPFLRLCSAFLLRGLLFAAGALLALAAFAAGPETYPPFRSDLPAGAAYAIDARRLHPAQLALGWREVAYKQKLIEGKSPAELVAYLKDKDVPVVIGPGGVPYLTDGHHTLRALLESGVADKTTYGHVLANWSAMAPEAFWREMEANHYSYLRDGAGHAQPPAALPADLAKLQLDPYRGLAWGVMKAGGFTEQKKVFFQEFQWAEFFRSRIQWDDRDDAAFARAVQEAGLLARQPEAAHLPGYIAPLQPRVVTEPTRFDTDDPAIWINPADPLKSLIVGTDKNSDGALYVYNLDGKIVQVVDGLKRPNNVDISGGLVLGGKAVDIAVTTERERQRLRVFTLPDMKCVDRGDLVVFDGDKARAPMGVALYRRPRDGALFAITGGKSGPAEGYLAQYRLEDDGTGGVKLTLVRQFGAYSGKKEIEAIAVDAELGYVYYSDETFGVRKYAADPDAPDAGRELARFGTTGFVSDHEGISIYRHADGTGYILVSDQQANRFQVFPREGRPGKPHEHPLLRAVTVAAVESDGSEVTNVPLGANFPHGLFVAMSNGKVFHYYSWDDVAAAAGLR